MLGDREGIQGTLNNLGWKLTWKLAKGRVKTDWEAAFKEVHSRLGPEWEEFVGELVANHTQTGPGTRRFYPSWPKEPKTKGKKK
jgi:hypothetical protein